jgi:hypothetical protein
MLAVLESKAVTLTREAQDAVKALNQAELKMAPKQEQAQKQAQKQARKQARKQAHAATSAA